MLFRRRENDTCGTGNRGLQALRTIGRGLPGGGEIQVCGVDRLEGAMLCRVDLVRDQRQRF